MQGMTPEQRVRIALAILQAREADRPVPAARLLRELPDMEPSSVEAALEALRARRLAHEDARGWILLPPPTGDDATQAKAQMARIHHR